MGDNNIYYIINTIIVINNNNNTRIEERRKEEEESTKGREGNDLHYCPSVSNRWILRFFLKEWIFLRFLMTLGIEFMASGPVQENDFDVDASVCMGFRMYVSPCLVFVVFRVWFIVISCISRFGAILFNIRNMPNEQLYLYSSSSGSIFMCLYRGIVCVLSLNMQNNLLAHYFCNTINGQRQFLFADPQTCML